MKLTLVRHGEVDKKYKNCYNGDNDIGLSKEGKLQAKELAKELDVLTFDAVFCSDLRRAKETLKHSLHAKEASYSNKLREKSWGEHEGLSFEQIIAQGKIEYIDFAQWIEALDGEPYEEFAKRVRAFFLEFLPSLKKERILVITHAGVIRVLLSLINALTLEEAFSIKVEHASQIKINMLK
ncbi:histidine phosphatase family protein [Sulfurimonas sp.]|jgi:broad specificity phosphatase PhoE|uniref:histidine phosphatase family protein n=1 Tax=Sulfurimonas sp. TaxID=2022749 RepID=UPI0025FEE4A0|nr:histidine phosphatase family protein [Sulfurimonas sp.]MCK9472857.1 histidine phosphatase family protein [Sulfurimonas sp.]MDD3504944.1 histidine phosphatase family protein [Sulfurimonas sp.]